MGYSTTFRLKGELDSKFKGWKSNSSQSSDKDEYKSILEATCLMASLSYDKKESFLSSYLHKVYKDVLFALRTYTGLLANEWKVALMDELKENNNEVELYGWQFSDSGSRAWKSKEDLEEYFAKQLFLLAATPTLGQFDKDNEDYEEKSRQISSYVEDIEECLNECLWQEFVEFYRDNSELADEDDGYSHRFPEHQEEDDEEREKETEEEPIEHTSVSEETAE